MPDTRQGVEEDIVYLDLSAQGGHDGEDGRLVDAAGGGELWLSQNWPSLQWGRLLSAGRRLEGAGVWCPFLLRGRVVGLVAPYPWPFGAPGEGVLGFFIRGTLWPHLMMA